MLDYLYGGEILCQAGEVLKPRLLTDYELVYIIKGSVSYTANDETFSVPPGGMILGRSGTMEAYRWDTTQTTRHAYFHFSINTLPSDWPEPDEWPRIRAKPAVITATLFRHVMLHIYEHSDWPAIAPANRDCLLLETLIDTFLETHTEEEKAFETERPEPVRRALKWMRQQIDDDPARQFSLEEIAAAAGCTDKHLCRIFRQSIGHTPVKVGKLLRLQLSLALLARTNLSIKEVAMRCGFEDPLYFSRCFSQSFKRPPSTIRKDLSKGVPPPPDPLPIDITPRLSW
ncbi:MAG: helix-turn-helix domain-containing protein [Kiritimatiellae bacterium]|jgi:AraC-like DNA-binding protein|nr:helix-turn-helix domain-containing protein [Kiritimatiellia bacterium]